jgi:hypothetical protein
MKDTDKPGVNEWRVERNCEAMVSFLPKDWKKKVKKLGILFRNRKFMTAETLLRVLLIHIGCVRSLRIMSALSKESGWLTCRALRC